MQNLLSLNGLLKSELIKKDKLIELLEKKVSILEKNQILNFNISERYFNLGSVQQLRRKQQLINFFDKVKLRNVRFYCCYYLCNTKKDKYSNLQFLAK